MIICGEILVEMGNQNSQENLGKKINIPAINDNYIKKPKLNLGKFFSNVFWWLCLGIILMSLISYWISRKIMKYIDKKDLEGIAGIILLMVIVFILGSFLVDIFLYYSINSSNFELSLIFYLLGIVCMGIALSPIIIYGMFYDFKNIILAFIIAIVFFVLLGLFAFYSGVNFEILYGVILLGSILMTLLLIAKLITYLFFQEVSKKIDLMSCSVGLILSCVMTIYDVQKLKYLAQKTHDNNQSLKALEVAGASILLKTFTEMFMYIFRILQLLSKKDKN